MNILDTLLEYLEDNDIGTVGENLLSGEATLNQDAIVWAVLSPSPDPDKAIPYYVQTVDFWCRYADFDDGYAKLQAIFDLLHRKRHYDIGDYHVYLSYAQGMIQDQDRDIERRHLLQLSFSIKYRRV